MQIEQITQTIRKNPGGPKKKHQQKTKQSLKITAETKIPLQRHHTTNLSTQTINVQSSSLATQGANMLQSSKSQVSQQLQAKQTSAGIQHQKPLSSNLYYLTETPQIKVSFPENNRAIQHVRQQQSPPKVKARNVQSDKDFFEQLADFKVLDKVLPCFSNLESIYVQIIKTQEFATIVSTNNQGDLIVKKLNNSAEEQVQSNQVRFLTGAYVHPLSEIDISKASDQLAIDLDIRDDSKLDMSIILIQTISQLASQEDPSKNGSTHRLHALVINNIVGDFKLHPVSFTNSQKNNKRQQKQPLSSEPNDSKEELGQFVYGEEECKRILKFSRDIQSAYSEYKEKIIRVPLNEENSEQLLYSLCYVYDKKELPAEQQQPIEVGIFTKFRDSQAFVRFFRIKPEKKDEQTQKWLDLSDYQITADLTIGFVSQVSLYQRNIFDSKLRSLQFVSQTESQSQNKFQVLAPIEELCHKCKYPQVDQIKNLVCGKCQFSFHDKCLLDHQTLQDNSGAPWYCPDCIRCQNCKAGQPEIIVCKECNKAVHYECIDKKYQQKIRNVDKQQLLDYRCESCIYCRSCDSKSPDENQNAQWSTDFQFCTACDKKRELRQYCLGCLKFWNGPEQTQNMLQCNFCCMWVHKECDRMFEDQSVLKKLLSRDEDDKPQILFACVECRQKARADFISQLVDFMIAEDKRKEFFDPFWELPSNAGYLYIIKDPLCFKMIKDEIEEYIVYPNTDHKLQMPELRYLLKPELLQQDIDRIFNNAKKFNPINNEIHKLAIRMHEKCTQIVSQGRIREILGDNSKVTQDELLHLKQIRGQLTHSPVYQTKPKDMSQMQEQIDVKQYQYLLKNLQEALSGQVGLGKRTRDSQYQNISKRIKLENGASAGNQGEFEPQQVQQTYENRKIFSEANDRLLRQNLTKILQTIKSAPLVAADKSLFKETEQNQAQMSPRSKWKSLMDDLRSSDERDSCWYSNPVRVSFDDPSLIFEEMCYLCGAFGLREEFLCCNLCGESYHPYCLPCPKENSIIGQDDWFCYNCIFCEKCHSSKNWEGLVLCAVCDKADHFWCLEPQLIVVPECSWKCQDCFKCRACGTKDFFSEEDIANKVNLDPNQKYVLSFDFEFCFQCGQDQYKKSICNICQNKTDLGLHPSTTKKNSYSKVEFTTDEQCRQQGILKCTSCKFYSHISCSKTSPEMIEALSKTDYFEGYKCLDCLLLDKSAGFILHEQCNVFENIHQKIETFQTINQLCYMLLQKYTPESLVIDQFIQQNFEWLTHEPLVVKWIELLKTEVDYEMSDASNTEANSAQEQIEAKQIQTTSAKENFAEGLLGMSQDSEMAQISEKQEFSLYFNLYTNNYKAIEVQTEIPAIKMDLNLLKTNSVNFSEVFVNVEFRAIIKIRNHFFNWFENSIVGPAIQNQDLFLKSTAQQPYQIQSMPSVLQENNQVVESDQVMTQQQDEVPEVLCNEPDVTIVNPQNRLTCILCQQSGEKRITGRLIPFQVNQFVHVNCAMWTSEVQEGTEENVVSSELYNFYFAFRDFRNNVCAFCGLKGATLICQNHSNAKKCPQPFFHFPCAYQSKVINFLKSIEVNCEQCSKKEKQDNVGLPIKFKDYHRRRIIIVKNLKPQCTNAFKSENEPEIDTIQPEYIIQCNKWRPYYYDMFNRAGNLTIISLSSKANKIIETLHCQTNQQITWHERLKKKSLNESLAEFASVRILWKNASKQKGFYLFTQNEVRQLQGKDVRQLTQFMHRQLKQRLSLPAVSLDSETESLSEFWQKLIGFLRQRYENFSQDSTYLVPQLICGLEKYPIQFWNNPIEKVGVPLRDLSVANFFYKSADLVIQRQRLYTQITQPEPVISYETPHQSDLNSIFQKMLKANKFVNHDGFTPAEFENLGNPKFKTNQTQSEHQIRQVLSSLNRSQPVLNQLSVKQMNYDQIMGCLGKKTIHQRKMMRQAQTNQLLIDSEDETRKQSTVQQMTDLEITKQNPEIVQSVKLNEINMAMKYRSAKDRPKAVEVWTSKIHRNGLFACQQFAAKDIVIEYVGEKIRVPVADKREKYYEKIGVGDCYLFSLDTEHIIDATFYGSKARYINHSCDPNLRSEKIEVNGETHIIFTAIRQIEKDEELTFDYQFEYEAEKLECFCGTAVCKGRLN